MRFLVIYKDKYNFLTDWYIYENCWSDDIFCIIDLYNLKISFDGKVFKIINNDHL